MLGRITDDPESQRKKDEKSARAESQRLLRAQADAFLIWLRDEGII